MKTLLSRARGVLIPAMFLTLIGWLVPANSFAQAGRAQSKFYLGADISSLVGGRGGGGRGGATVHKENGQEGTEFGIMMKHGWNAFRLRVFVSPVRSTPNNSL
jgi:arabinogalactan endo-1,4-beta-galactosidase